VFSVSHRNQEQFIRLTAIKKFAMDREYNVVFWGDDSEEDKENDEIDLF
jgi:hypothetical protein